MSIILTGYAVFQAFVVMLLVRSFKSMAAY
jgi:hypothetical protein